MTGMLVLQAYNLLRERADCVKTEVPITYSNWLSIYNNYARSQPLKGYISPFIYVIHKWEECLHTDENIGAMYPYSFSPDDLQFHWNIHKSMSRPVPLLIHILTRDWHGSKGQPSKIPLRRCKGQVAMLICVEEPEGLVSFLILL